MSLPSHAQVGSFSVLLAFSLALALPSGCSSSKGEDRPAEDGSGSDDGGDSSTGGDGDGDAVGDGDGDGDPAGDRDGDVIGDGDGDGDPAGDGDGDGDGGLTDSGVPIMPPGLGGKIPKVSAPEVLGVLVGPGATHSQADLQLYGTDLGFPYVNDGKLFLLFGDSIATPESICESVDNDDALGVLPLSFDGTLPELELLTSMAEPDRFGRIRLMRDGVSQVLGLGQVPIGGFVDEGRVYALFNRLQFDRCVPDGAGARCPSGAHFDCTDRLGICEPTRNVVVPPLCNANNGSGCMLGQSCAEADPGFCIDPTSSQNDGTVAGEIASVVQTLELGIAQQDEPTVFDYAASFSTNKLTNPALRTVAHFTGERAGNDYQAGDGALLLFGRPGFAGEDGRQVQLYLMVQRLPIAVDDAGAATLTPEYFAGLDPDSQEPRWTSNQAEAKPIALDGGFDGDPHEPLHLVNQMTVSWLGAPVSKWVMLYGGDISDLLVLNAPALRNGPSPGSIVMRFADHPWGPFTEPAPHLLPGSPGEVGDAYGPGGFAYHPSCRDTATETCAPPDAENVTGTPCLDALTLWDQGRLYGATILDPYTHANDQGGLDMVWTVSTWNPYHVVMLKTSLTPR